MARFRSRPIASVATTAIVACTLAGSLVACSSDFESLTLASPQIRGSQPMPAPIAREVDERYGEALGAGGVEVKNTEIPASERVNAIRSGQADVTFGCVGELLFSLDAAKATQLAGLYENDTERDAATWRDIVHSSMLGSLPADVGASDPGIAQPCGDDGLPQNLVALYDKEAIDRFDRTHLNNVAGGVSDEDLGDGR